MENILLNYSYPEFKWFDFSTDKVATGIIYQDLDEQKEIKPKI